jgi:ligand-binding sensor domain-containing protein
MWVGTRRGLALFDGFTLAAVWPDGVNPSPFNSNVVNDVAHVGDSTYVATNDGVYVTKTTEGVVWQRRVAGLPSVTVTSIKGFGNDVWCIAGTRVLHGGQTGTWAIEETGLAGTSPVTLTARDGHLFLGGSNGVYEWDGAASWQALGSGFPGRAWVDIDPSGTIWAGNPEGLWRWNGTSWLYYRSDGPSGNWVQGMQLTGSTLWIATRDLGMSRFDGTGWRNYFPTQGYGVGIDSTFYVPDVVFGLLADNDGTVWAGQWGQSIAHVNGAVEPPSFDHFYDPSEGNFEPRNTFLWSSALDPQGNRYFGYDTPDLANITPIGINRVGTDGSRTNFSPPAQAMSGPQIRSIAFAPGQAWEMWVAYARLGVDVFTDPTLDTRLDHLQTTRTEAGTVIPGLLSLDTWAIEFNGDDVWIGDSNGLTRWSRTTRRRLESVSTPSPSSQGAVHPLSIDAEGGVWWATASGVFHRRPDRSIEAFNEDNSPLLSNDVHSVFVDKATGDVWIGSVRGVNRYNPSAQSGGGVTVADGASSTSIRTRRSSR